MIDYGAGEPPYMQVAAIVRARITSGELAGRIPSERALAQEYGVALNTARKAVAVLKDEGLVFTRKGWGTFTAGGGEDPGR
jgi:DNA-binding GntR family transcriptional regulator